MMFNVLKDYHIMIGIPPIERHKAIFPPPLPPLPWMMHWCVAPLCIPPWGGLTGKPNGSVFTSGLGRTLSQGTDIGPLIPHINIPPAPPNLLLPIIILTSASKSEFGAHGHVAPQGPVAFAVLKVVNLNLNCAGPAQPPAPSGLVITFNTNTTGVTIGDIVAGVVHMVFDSAVQYGLNQLFNSNMVTNLFERLTSALAAPIFARIAPWAVGAFTGDAVQVLLGGGTLARMLGEGFIDNILPAIASELLGSPLGYSPGWSPAGGLPGPLTDKGHTAVQQAVDNYFNNPSVEQHPSQPPSAQPSDQPPPHAGPPAPPSAQPPTDAGPPPAPSSSQPPADAGPPPPSPTPSGDAGPPQGTSSQTTPSSGAPVCDPSDPDSP